MATNFDRTALSLHKRTIQEINSRSYDRDFSAVADAWLSRCFSLLEIVSPVIEKKFTQEDLHDLMVAIDVSQIGLRNTSIQMMRLIVKNFLDEGLISEKLARKVSELPIAEFLGLVDHLERLAKKNRPKTRTKRIANNKRR